MSQLYNIDLRGLLGEAFWPIDICKLHNKINQKTLKYPCLDFPIIVPLKLGSLAEPLHLNIGQWTVLQIGTHHTYICHSGTSQNIFFFLHRVKYKIVRVEGKHHRSSLPPLYQCWARQISKFCLSYLNHHVNRTLVVETCRAENKCKIFVKLQFCLEEGQRN